MAINQKSPPKQTTAPRPNLVPLVPVSSDSNGNAKRKKKKKGKGRADVYEDDDEEDTGHPEPTPPITTGLSPELESVHLSANAALDKARPSQRELQDTAHELYSHFMDPPGMNGDDGDEYWKNLPAQTREFVRNVHSQAALSVSGGEVSKAQTMYAIAQQMMQSGKGTKGIPGSYPVSNRNIPFDSSVLSDPAIKLSLEAALNSVTAKGGFPPLGLGEQGYAEAEYFSEEEGGHALNEVDLGVEVMDGRHTTSAQFTLTYDSKSGLYPTFTAEQQTLTEDSTPSEAGKRRKNKKKNKKTNTPSNPLPPPATLNPEPRPRPAPTPAPTTIPTRTNTSIPPQPPSSRAAGKQPMSYSSMNSAAQNPPLGPPSRPSARAASKAPLANYGHHHHASPPTSNASALASLARLLTTWPHQGREQERKDLVKVEKEAVLRKMKEQQKHGCGCAVCGRKRQVLPPTLPFFIVTAIEEELEVLYEAYYEDLEQYANLQQQYASSGGPPPPGPGPFPGSVALDSNGAVIGAGTNTHPTTKHPPNHRKHATPPVTNGHVRKPRAPPVQDEEEFDEGEDDYDDDDEEYDEEDEEEGDDEEEVDEEEEDGKPAPMKTNDSPDMFSIGSNFAAAGPGNILTVADDLLKNDGQKFLEMMEQLAERRMMREDEAVASVEDDSDDDDDDEEEDEEEDDDDDDDEEDHVPTEEQKMQEGKRMFSIFAARMFEQRVLQAYRERVAQERQLQLLRELEDEERAAAQKESKKQNANQKKKDKKRQQKAVKDEERIRREAERAEEEAALKAKQEAAEEAQRKKREEEKVKREAERLKREEEKMRQAEERRKRIAEEQRKAAERAALEQKRAAEKAAERAAKEKERKDREERDRKAKEEALREEREAKVREEEIRKEKEKEAAEKKATELLAQQQRQASAKATLTAKAPPSPRNVASGSSQRTSPAPKKILIKAPQSVVSPSGPRSVLSPTPVLLSASPASAEFFGIWVSSCTLPNSASFTSSWCRSDGKFGSSISPPTGDAGERIWGVPPTLWPHWTIHKSFPTTTSPGVPRPYPPPLMDVGFENGSGYPKASTGLPPIGPPKGFNGTLPPNQVAPGSSLSSPITMGSRHAPSPYLRLTELVAMVVEVQRPIAPISRPVGASASQDEEKAPSGSSSRRSPSPSSFLGSKALINDDDEPILPASGRRVGVGATPVGQSWGALARQRRAWSL
ncbi:hypothetical protein BS47DRAFT_1393230 [Hydnum rufescens UP504]|uniref:Stress response protein NST1 n=1 Tax=Hydnum rufescens UP504 TaxID=1448309 RepID=A0A9P6AX40_9AGAM|nr:hypothetical protein BS47DRAFT_1393230 [Hydnum rufescens UP504]